MTTPKKGKGKRRRKNTDPKVAQKKKQIKLYFNEGTQKAIEEFQAAETDEEKNEIYTESILPAFDKLSENLIFIHKFTSLHESYEDLKNDCVTFLYETLYKFDPSRGTKAFSYFNVVAKNFLIIKSKQKTAFLRRSVSIEDERMFSSGERHSYQEKNVVDSPVASLVKEDDLRLIFGMLKHLTGEARTDNEKACINAITTLFENANDLEFLNKRAIFVYMRDLSGLNAKQLSVSMSAIRKYYKEILESGQYQVKFKEE